MFEKLKQKYSDAKAINKATRGAFKELMVEQMLEKQQKTVSFYDKYRVISGILVTISSFIALIFGHYALAITLFCLTHVHLLFNQMWWKLVNLEYNYMRREYAIDDGNREIETGTTEEQARTESQSESGEERMSEMWA